MTKDKRERISKGYKKQRRQNTSVVEEDTISISDGESLLTYLINFKLEDLLSSVAVVTKTKSSSGNYVNGVEENNENNELTKLVELSERL